MQPADLPGINATLNGIAAILLLVGRRLVKRRRIGAHRRAMLAAFATSSAFLVLYVVHKASRGFESTTLHVEGLAKAAYLMLLFSHVTLAMAVPPIAVTLIYFGLTGRIQRHRRLARVGWPIWMYVSVTGVLIYVLLYHLDPGPPAAGAG